MKIDENSLDKIRELCCKERMEDLAHIQNVVMAALNIAIAPYIKLYENINDSLQTVLAVNSKTREQTLETVECLKRLEQRMDLEAEKSNEWQDRLSEMARRDSKDKQSLMEAILEAHKWQNSSIQQVLVKNAKPDDDRMETAEPCVPEGHSSVPSEGITQRPVKRGPLVLGKGLIKPKRGHEEIKTASTNNPLRSTEKVQNDENFKPSYEIFQDVQKESKQVATTGGKTTAKDLQNKLGKKSKNQVMKRKECGSRSFLRNIKLPDRELLSNPAKKPRVELKIVTSDSKKEILNNQIPREIDSKSETERYLSDLIEVIEEHQEDERWQNIGPSEWQNIDNQLYYYEQEEKAKYEQKRERHRMNSGKMEERKTNEARKCQRSDENQGKNIKTRAEATEKTEETKGKLQKKDTVRKRPRSEDPEENHSNPKVNFWKILEDRRSLRRHAARSISKADLSDKRKLQRHTNKGRNDEQYHKAAGSRKTSQEMPTLRLERAAMNSKRIILNRKNVMSIVNQLTILRKISMDDILIIEFPEEKRPDVIILHLISQWVKETIWKARERLAEAGFRLLEFDPLERRRRKSTNENSRNEYEKFGPKVPHKESKNYSYNISESENMESRYEDNSKGKRRIYGKAEEGIPAPNYTPVPKQIQYTNREHQKYREKASQDGRNKSREDHRPWNDSR
ncbi:trichohyalin-like [Ambystoma mexicanum]|uniref:trichohyalin-like n=1 Tax=Ambystoma mexicanum TaxID=8296 RepID=UPI0037E8DB46